MKFLCLSYFPAYEVTLFYVKVKDELMGTDVDEGTIIGEMTDMATEYGNDGKRDMTNHVHLQLELRRMNENDPDRYFDTTHFRC